MLFLCDIHHDVSIFLCRLCLILPLAPSWSFTPFVRVRFCRMGCVTGGFYVGPDRTENSEVFTRYCDILAVYLQKYSSSAGEDAWSL